MIGNCENGKKIIDLIAKNVKSDDIIVSENSRTNYKMRLIADGQHIVRADWNNNKINEKQELVLIEKLSHYIDEVDCVIISDYARVFVQKKFKENN